MYIEEILNKVKLPTTYLRNGVTCFLDPIRKKLVQITPEEIVRQKIISYIIEYMKVPSQCIKIEVPLKYYGINSKRRADIIIERKVDNGYQPLAVIECKAENIELTQDVALQVIDYGVELDADYMVMSNGFDFIMVKYDSQKDKCYQVDEVPTYSQMIDDTTKTSEIPAITSKRTKLSALNDIDIIQNQDEELARYMIGEDTPDRYKPFIVNLGECFLDTSRSFPIGQYGEIKVLEDIGLRYASYGSAAGGGYTGLYRTLLIEDSIENTQSISFSVMACGKSKDDPIFGTRTGASVLIVSIDDFDKSHNSLELRIDNHLKIYKNEITLWHSGKIAVGNKGSGKAQELKELTYNRYPDLICNDIITLGQLKGDKLYYMDDPDVIELIIKLICYSLARDEYRNIVKSRIS